MTQAFSELPRSLRIVEKMEGRLVTLKDLRSHVVPWVRHCTNTTVIVMPNQRCSTLVMSDCKETILESLDSAVIASRCLRAVNCSKCTIMIEDVDIRRVELWNCTDTTISVMNDEILMEEVIVITHPGCSNTEVQICDFTSDGTYDLKWNAKSKYKVPESAEDAVVTTLCPVTYVHSAPARSEDGARLINSLLKTTFLSLPCDEEMMRGPTLCPRPDALMNALTCIEQNPPNITKEDVDAAFDRERIEIQQSPAEVKALAAKVAEKIRAAKHVVVFTGAGVSTAADIPDFRGPQGTWTVMAKTGTRPSKDVDITECTPTYSHYAITELARRGIVKFVISTNFDGLHCRSGLPRHLIEELHGSAYKEFCPGCQTWYIRGHIVYRVARPHWTGNRCPWCDSPMMHTDVAFGDTYRSELTPVISGHHARKADYTLVLGTSMAVQPAVTYPIKALKNPGGGMALVNMQYTPADSFATERIYTKCDIFMYELMQALGITDFDMQYDALPDWTEVSKLQEQLLINRMKKHKERSEGVKVQAAPSPASPMKDID